MDADDGEHAAGVALRGAMGEEELALATGASTDLLNGTGFEACCQKLPAIGFKQIKVQAGADGRVAGRALGQEEHGVFGVDGVGVIDLVEEIVEVRELGLEGGEDLFADGVATGADAGADGGDQVFRQ